MNRRPSGISSLLEEQQSWRVTLPEINSDSKMQDLVKLSGRSGEGQIPARAARNEKYQFIPCRTLRRITEPRQLESILTERGIDCDALFAASRTTAVLASNAPFLSLELFDDWEYDSFSAEKVTIWHAVEAFAFIRSNHRWQRVAVVNHHPASNRWEVTVRDNPGAGSFHWVPRPQLYFPFEDPGKFADRILAAISERREAENAIRFRFLCKHLHNDGHFAPGGRLKASIQSHSASSGEVVYEVFRAIYEHFHLALALGRHLASEGSTLPIKQPGRHKSQHHTVTRVVAGNFDELLDCFRRRTLLCDRNVFHALRLLNHECELVRKLPLFVATAEQPITLDEFERRNQTQTSRTLKYLQNSWIERATMHLHRTLPRIGRGNFDVFTRQWKVYSLLKLKRLMEQVQYRMQDALRDLLLDSTAAYVDFLVNDCDAVFALGEEYSWDGNLIDSPFVPRRRSAVFQLTLEMGDEAPYYSTDPERFPVVLRDIMDSVLKQSHYIHTVEPSVMQSMIFADDLYLSSLGLLDPAVVECRQRLLEYYHKALLPLRGYAARFAAYKDLFFTTVKEFIERVKSADKSSSELKEDIALQIRMRENLEHTVPLSIVIGPFLIITQPLREALIQKRQELTAALLKLLTEKLQLKTADLLLEYGAINERMCEKPISIEHIYETRHFLESVPDTVARMEDRMKGVLYEYEILEGFQCSLPDADFQQKWNALAFPRTVLRQLSSVREFLESEVEKFRKQQFADEAAFIASVDDLNAYIAKFTTLYDTGKVSEMAVEVRRLWKALQALIDHGNTLNRRQELFELAPISLTNLFDLRTAFATYRDLWTVAADYLKLEESWIGNPLASVDLESVRRSLQQAHDSLNYLLPQFAEQPQLVSVVEHFLHTVEAFRPNVDVMELLKCPHLEAIHWGQLAKEAGIKGKLSVDIGFDVFLEHGIGSHVEAVRRIVAKAEEQREEQEQRRAAEERVRQQEEAYRRARAERRQQRADI